MNSGITISFLSHAADIIASGLTGSRLVTYCNSFAVDHNTHIPHAVYPFHAPNKRTALLENLRAFPPSVQYRLLMELCSDVRLDGNLEVEKLRQLLEQRYSQLGSSICQPVAMVADTGRITDDVPAAVVNPPSPSPISPITPYDIFLSYAHEDESLVNLVRDHLAIYKRKGLIRNWWDRKLLPGTPIDEAITKRLGSSEIVLLFISSSFLASDYCYEVEMEQALRQHKEEKSVVVPVILRHCQWHEAPFGNLLALPTDGRPIVSWSDRDEAAKSVADGVMRLVAKLQADQIHRR